MLNRRDPLLTVPRNAIIYRDELKKGRISNAYFVFADVRGFTPLTESLKKLGKEGAERIAMEINALMEPICKNALSKGGNIIAIEGDAILVSFENLADALSFSKKIISETEGVIDTGTEEFSISIDVGLSRGPFYEAIIGDEERRVYFTAGSGLKGAYLAEKLANSDVVSNFEFAHTTPIRRG